MKRPITQQAGRQLSLPLDAAIWQSTKPEMRTEVVRVLALMLLEALSRGIEEVDDEAV